MAKQYYFRIGAKFPPNFDHQPIYREIIATSVSDAKNRFKERQPDAKIVTCVKCEEYKPKENSSSIGGTLLTGLLAVAGTALAAKFLDGKK